MPPKKKLMPKDRRKQKLRARYERQTKQYTIDLAVWNEHFEPIKEAFSAVKNERVINKSTFDADSLAPAGDWDTRAAMHRYLAYLNSIEPDEDIIAETLEAGGMKKPIEPVRPNKI